MGSTTVHIPEEMLERIDAIARRRGTSRNRVVLASLEAEIIRDNGEWPSSFFDPLGHEERVMLVEATRELEDVVTGSRKNRGAVLLRPFSCSIPPRARQRCAATRKSNPFFGLERPVK